VGSLDALLTVQDLDTRTDQLRHRRETLPERGELAAAQRSVKETEELADVARTRLRELKASEKALEDEAATVEAHAADIQRKMYDGTITAAKELEAFQTDHEHLKKRQIELEDRAIEILEAAEPIEAELAALTARVEAATASVIEIDERLVVAEAEIDAEVERVRNERAAAAGEVPPVVLSAYEPMRLKLGGVGAARLTGNRCEGCHLQIPSAELEGIRHAADDALVTCPECGRLLVR